MSFKRKNVAIVPIGAPSSLPQSAPASVPVTHQPITLAAGVRPSAIDGRLTTSTGTASLDETLAGHSGIPLGTSLLLQESTTTDFGGVVLRYFASEGMVQGHQVHVVGVPEVWKTSLPGLAAKQESSSKKAQPNQGSDERMKIAWRYESLANRNGVLPELTKNNSSFCHKFDLNKRLESSAIKGQFIAYPLPLSGGLVSLISQIRSKINSGAPNVVHRIIIPNFLIPTSYPPSSCRPSESLQFLHGLRAILRQFPDRTAAIMTLSADLFPPDTGLVKWMEALSDGVAHLVPTQSEIVNPEETAETIQGYFTMRRLPIFNEKGGGLEKSSFGETLSFKLSSSSGLVIAPLALPPAVEDEPAPADHSHSKNDPKKLEF
ncbi:hypothetical protein TD95_003026 [Thielaviopsis punctulata]|uniref:Elongator complex protein 4 n=1 Tax=Thielaviopsis punctulata TaxID=72032 RepID=A0A0F4ZDY8_9PEZI|nr:hypothetical protein TD95_003026 [Thielaviopsis punctulata]